MSFHVHFLLYRVTGELRPMVNPFTGAMVTLPTLAPLSNEEVQAARGVLARAGLEADGFVKLPDGGRAHLEDASCEQGLRLSIHRWSPGLARLLFELLVAARWSLSGDDDLTQAIVAHPDAPPLGEDEIAYGRRQLAVTSPEELAALLAAPWLAAQGYRAQVLDQAGSKR